MPFPILDFQLIGGVLARQAELHVCERRDLLCPMPTDTMLGNMHNAFYAFANSNRRAALCFRVVRLDVSLSIRPSVPLTSISHDPIYL